MTRRDFVRMGAAGGGLAAQHRAHAGRRRRRDRGRGKSRRGARDGCRRVFVRFFGHHGVAQVSNTLDAHHHIVAGLQVARRLAREADAAGGSGRDHVAGLEREDAGEVSDQVRNGEDEVARVGVLQLFAVDGQPDVQVVRVGDFIQGDDARAHGREGVEALADGPLGGGHLIIARADVVQDGVAEHVVAPVRRTDVAAALADDEGELGLVVGFGG